MSITAGAMLGMSAIGAASKTVNGLLDFAYKNALMDKKYNLEIRKMKEGPQAMQQGLLAAGINPAAMFGGSGGFKAGQKIPQNARQITHDKMLANNNGITSTNARDYQYKYEPFKKVRNDKRDGINYGPRH
nr:MAG: hypothetical protein [Microvirus Sku122]